MNKIKIFLAGMVAMAAVCACSSDDDNVVVVPTETTSSDTVHVAVVLPQYILEDWQNSIEYALKNIAKAQQLEQHKVVLKLHFYDEETENLDKLAFRLVMPEKGGVSGGEIEVVGEETGYWISSKTKVRHNKRCRNYRRVKGHPCGPNDGRPCKTCGG